MAFLTSLLPSNFVIILFLIVGATAGYFYLQNNAARSQMETLQVRLDGANERIRIQTNTIIQLQRDAEIQRELLDASKYEIEKIRRESQREIEEIRQLDFSQLGTDIVEFARQVNERFGRLLNNIAQTSQKRN